MLSFVTEITVSDICAVITSLVALFSCIVGFRRWKKELSLKRADYIKGLTDKIRCDPTIRYVFYLLDYGANWYSEEFHSGGDMEQKMDQGLSYFSYLCYLENKEIITPEEFKFFEYEIKRILL